MKMKLVRRNSTKIEEARARHQKPASFIAARGWKPRKVSPLPVEGEIFSLTFPLIDQAFTLITDWL
jgi:hypothetical protein